MESLQEALDAIADSSWSVRRAGALELGTNPTDPRAFEALTLLLDDENTAVIEVAASGLASGAGVAGLLEIVRAMGRYADGDNAGYHVRDALAKLDFNGFPIKERLAEMRDSPELPDQSRPEVDYLIANI